MDTITIDVGVYTALEIDLTEFDFTGISKVVMTFKNVPSLDTPAVFTREFVEPKVHRVVITPEESLKLIQDAAYDFAKVLIDGKTYKNGDNGKIELRKGCGQCQNL